jgi:hypothetical protein
VIMGIRLGSGGRIEDLVTGRQPGSMPDVHKDKETGGSVSPMRTVGVALAAEPAGRSGTAEVVVADCPGTDDAIRDLATSAAKVGIDCPLDRPDSFVEFLIAHRALRPWSPDGVSNADRRRSLANQLRRHRGYKGGNGLDRAPRLRARRARGQSVVKRTPVLIR